MAINILKHNKLFKPCGKNFSILKESQSFNETDINPFFNRQTAMLKKELDAIQNEIKTWQTNFINKFGRKPTLEEM
jgi:hypothetical protein